MGRSNEGRLYVGRLSHRTRERDLERLFSPYGRIREILLKSGFAFVEFEDTRDAEDACYELNGKDLLGDRIVVEMAKGTERGRGGLPMRGQRDKGWMDKYGPFKRTDYRVIVGNLSTRVSWQDLKDMMRKVGCEVCYADAHKHRKNEAVIEFATRSDMKRAIQKYDGHEVNGRKMEVHEDRRSRSRSRSKSKRSRSRSGGRRSASRSATPPRKRARSGSRSKSRSRSGSRNRSVERARSGSRSRSRSPARESPERKNGSRRSASREKASPRRSDRSRSRSDSPRPRDGSRSRSPRVRSSSKDDRSASRERSVSREREDSRERANGDRDEDD
ncbi:serine/arginine-rich splicing factor 5 [Galendromus occidentalis]|uniref:Serine/arginine-rich splicing factor 5 n=1 Tax=Galendromus occidentalis TaxID=34638 RepID=A0AAJ7L6Y7_9ACAR|nr:serine/arginine-rich splicing factor 5 [Galendromus occidentalis]